MQTRAVWSTFCAALLVAAGAMGADRASERLAREVLPSTEDPNAPIDITAENMVADRDEGWVRYDGSVVITHGNTELRADRVRLNSVTGEIVAEGNVLLVRRNQGASRHDRLVYNYKTGEGLTTHIDVRAGVFRVLAEEGHRRPDGTISGSHTTVSTCTNDASHLHWCVTGSRLAMRPNDYVSVEDAVPRLFGVPFFYWPYWRRELDEHYGWRFQPGYSSRWGAFLLSAYKMPLAQLGDDGDLKSKTHIDLRSKRGLAGGEDILWRLGDTSHGFVSFYYLDDQKPLGKGEDPATKNVDSSRYRFTLQHDTRLTDRDLLQLRASYLSDTDLLEDFYEDEYRALRQPDNHLTYTHLGDTYAAGLGAYGRLNEFYDSVDRLPEAYIDTLPVDVGGAGLYYESETRGGWLQRQFADYSNPSNPPAASYDTVRFDSDHRLSLPRKAGFLNVVPRVGARGTYYADTFAAVTRTTPGGATTNGLTGTTTSTVYEPAGGDLRTLFELGCETSFKAYGLYEDAGGIFRHVIEPYANYTLIPEPNLRPDELPQFDSVDRLDKAHNVRIGTRNQIQRRGERGVYAPLDVDTYALYQFERADGEQGLDTLGVDARVRPADWLRWDAEATYDVIAGEVSAVDTWVTLWNASLWEATGEYYYRPDNTSLFAGSLTYTLSDAWAFRVYSRYDAERSQLEEQGGYLQYQLDCLVFRLNGRVLPASTRDDGSTNPTDYRVSLDVWLRAYPPQRVDSPY